MRTGNPDGGVEWYSTLADGTQHGWQAKHIHGIEDLLSAMTATVRRVAKERPNLTKLTFVISTNLNEGTSGRQRKSQRQKYDDKIAYWRSKIKDADRIEFALVQESDLLAKLAEPKHHGRAWFWWNTLVLDDGWFADRLGEKKEIAGRRYRPELQVDLPIQDDLKALGFAQSSIDRFERLRRRVLSDGRQVHIRASGPDELVARNKAIRTAAKTVVDLCDTTRMAAGSRATALDPLKRALETLAGAIHEGEALEWRLRQDWEELPKDDPERESKKPPDVATGYSVRGLRNSASELASWLDSTEGAAFCQRFYFLSGVAGSGKTHLFLDSARRALEEGRPAVVLFGSQFGQGDLWVSICDQLGLESVGSSVLLSALDSAGEASALTGRRSVIFVDALNDTVPPDFWRTKLPALRAAISHWPHVALAVSCRDTYVDLVEESDDNSQFVRNVHPGFGGREIEATQKYFEHYGLEAPRIPLLVPEFTVPLFLQMYCESLQLLGEGASAVGHEGRVRVFERYLAAKTELVARRMSPNAATGYERDHAKSRALAVIDSLLDEFATTGRDASTLDRAEELACAALEGDRNLAVVVLGALQNEGVLNRERIYTGNDGLGEGLRVSFQAFSDFLILKRRLEASDGLIRLGFRRGSSVWFSHAAVG